MSPGKNRACGAAVLAALLAIAALVPGARAQAAPDTLALDALLTAVEAAPAVRADRVGAAALDAEARAAGRRPDPEVEVSVNPAAFLGARGARARVQARQMLPYPGALAAERAAARARAEAAAFEADTRVADFRRDVRLAYYRLYRAQALDALVRQFQRRLGAFAEAAAVRYEVGRGPQGAILQAQLDAGRMEAELLELETMRHHALTELARLVGRPDLAAHARHGGGRAVVALPPPPPEADATLLARALAARPEFRALDAEAQAADAEVELARIAFRPAFGVGVGLSNMAGEMGDWRNALSVGMTVRLPLDRGRLHAGLEAAQLRRAEVDARREAVERDVEATLAQSVYDARQEAATLDLYRRRLLPQAETTAEAVLAAYTTGQGDLLDLLDAERTRFELRRAEEEARYRYLVALAELERALGAPLDAVDTPTDPTQLCP